MPLPRPSPAASLRLLRRYRGLPTGRATEIATELKAIARALGHAGRAEDAITQAWLDLAPAPLRERVSGMSLARGVLSLRTSDASARFEVDRWLRAGGQVRLARACGRGISRFKFTS